MDEVSSARKWISPGGPIAGALVRRVWESYMPETIPLGSARSGVDPAVVRESNGNGSNGKSALRHVREFEKPLAQLEQQIHELEARQEQTQVDYSKELRQLRTSYTSLLRKIYDNLNAWETVQVARHPQRPLFRDYVDMICREFREIHGDRVFG